MYSQLPAQIPVNGHSAVLTRVTNVGPPVASSITDKRHQTTSSTAAPQQSQKPTSCAVTGILRPGRPTLLPSFALPFVYGHFGVTQARMQTESLAGCICSSFACALNSPDDSTFLSEMSS